MYRARDRRLDRFVALKVLPAFANDESRRRFHTEARLASAVTHRNIVVVYDVGEDNGVPFIAMELVEGGNLRTRGDTAMPVDRLLKIAVQIADALRVAHNKGLAHRDLKPENVLLTSDDDVKLVDFGLAKVASSDVDATVGGTQSGLVLGTPGYMSPEQAKGLPSDWRSDQFSLGALLYELATGRRAFQRSSLVETANAAITDEPTSASELRPDLPQPLVWTIQRCLAKDPLQRYGATEDLYRDLAAIREHVAIPAAPSLSRSNVTPDAPVLVGRANDLVRLV